MLETTQQFGTLKTLPVIKFLNLIIYNLNDSPYGGHVNHPWLTIVIHATTAVLRVYLSTVLKIVRRVKKALGTEFGQQLIIMMMIDMIIVY